MDDRIISLLVFISIVLINFFMQILMPKLSRKELYFGVRIPKEYLSSVELKKMYSKYVIENVILLLLYIVICVSIPFKDENVFSILQGVIIFLYILLCFAIYYKTNIKVKLLKKENNWISTKKTATFVDINFTKDKSSKVLASPWWFLIPIFIIVINIMVNYACYDRLAEMLPTHWSAAGKINGWLKKSTAVKQMPAIQCFLTAIMFFSYKIIGWSKQQLSASNPEVSREQNLRFRYIWSVYIIAMCIIMNLLFTFANLTIIQVIKMNGIPMMIFTLVVVLAIIASSIILSVKVGQGGSKLKLSMSEENRDLSDRDDDKYWKFGGTIYFNKEDPAVFIEKRFGIGWTMNFARIQSIIIIVALLLLGILLPIILGK